MTEYVGQMIRFMNSAWADTFSLTVVIVGFTTGIVHIFLLFWAGFHRYPITRLMLGNGIFIFLVALCRLVMLIVAQSSHELISRKWGHQTLVQWCYVWKMGEIWAIGLANTCTAIMSVAYFRLIQNAWKRDLRTYWIGRDRTAIFFFILLFIISTVSTAFCMKYTGVFVINGSYCLALGIRNTDDNLFSFFLALCICCPAVVAIGFFIAGAVYLAMLNHRNRDSITNISSRELGSALEQLNNIQSAIQYSIISWFVTNFFDIFWVIYWPLSSNSSLDSMYYLASAQYATLQNVTDFIVNLHYFILPRLGYAKGLPSLWGRERRERVKSVETARTRNLSQVAPIVPSKEYNMLEEPLQSAYESSLINKYRDMTCSPHYSSSSIIVSSFNTLPSR